MTILAIGILLFFLTHIVPTMPVQRARIVDRVGEKPYKAGFSVLSLIGLGLIIYGFSVAPRMPGYAMPEWGEYVPLVAMPLAFILVLAAYIPCNIARWTWHPMTIGVLLWAAAHLMASPYAASGLLFGSFALYGVFNLLGQFVRVQPDPPPKQPVGKDIIVVFIGLSLFIVMTVSHHILFGVSALPWLFEDHGTGLPALPG
ncbi:NnrU family protein [uncultured Rhodospira sp.]|uniref:NnrU family protein n=1 Tax=uncultured Rhodospira sp. TaxID=1936189 RepID=UPI002607340A|nr:NnrU family protein [uncultured Rhodospira sp.]